MKKNIMLIGAVILLAAFITLSSTGSFLSTGILSISQVVLNGQDYTIVTMTGGTNADVLVASLDKNSHSNFDSDKYFTIEASKKKDTYQYTLTDRQGSSGTVFTYVLSRSCNGLIGANSCLGININTFKEQCLAENGNNIFYDAGDAINPKWRCYTATPKWLVSDFNTIGGTSNPEIEILMTEMSAPSGQGGNIIAQYSTTLSKYHTSALLTSGSTPICTASITGLTSTFTSPPSSSGIKALRPAGTNTNYMPVSGAVVDEWNAAYNRFQNCLTAAKKPTAGQPVFGLNFGWISTGFSYYESSDDQLMQGCFNRLNTDATTLVYLMPQGDFVNLDYSKLNSNKIVSLKNAFTIPQIKFECPSANIGVSRPTATPTAASCNSKTLPGGSTIGEFTASVTNGGNAGSVYVETTCTQPLTVRTPASSYAFTAYETKQLSVSVSLSPNNGTSTCTVKAFSTDLKTSVEGTCQIGQTAACSNSPRPGFYIDNNCVEYCPLKAADCPAPKILKTPATGYADQCVCDAATVTPGVCNNNGVCEAGETTGNCANDCHAAQDGTSATCYPLVQKTNNIAVGGITLFGFNFGGSVVQTCVWDFTVLGAILLAIAALLYKKRQKEAKALGIAGIVLLVLSFVADNALLIALGGSGIFLIAVVIAVAYVALRFGII